MPAKSFAKDRLRPQQPRLPSLQSIRIAKNKKGPKQKSPFYPALFITRCEPKLISKSEESLCFISMLASLEN